MISATPPVRRRRVAIAASLLVLAAVAGAVLGTRDGSSGHPRTGRAAPLPGVQRALVATGWQRTRIYHSPQSPGYTAWVGAWVMPDRSLMVAFTQATGPVDPTRRRLMPERVLERDFGLTEQPSKSPPYHYLNPHRDFWGLSQAVIYLRSTDGGDTWRVWRTDRFRAIAPQAYTPQADIALSDGTLIRRVSGYDLRNDPSIPHAALLQTLRFDPKNSGHQGASWSAPRLMLRDRSICTYNISRIHQLSDGRLIALGAVWRYAHGHSGPCAVHPYSVLLLVAASAQAAERDQWSLGMPYTTQFFPNEWDAAELPDGDLLALFRTQLGGQPTRLEAILRRHGAGWVMTPPRALPDLPAFRASGHPDLLATRQGAILSFSDTGTAYTFDGGTTWSELPFSDAGFDLRTRYYPYAVQAPDGTIEVFSHDGWDSPYGAYNESIVLDRFRLQIPVSVSQARLLGVSRGRPTLTFKAQVPEGGSPIRTIKIGLPSGVSFTTSRDLLERDISVQTPGGRRTAFSLDLGQLSEGRLLIELPQPATTAVVRISRPALLAENVVATAVATGRLRTLPVAVKTTDSRGVTALVSLTPSLR